MTAFVEAAGGSPRLLLLLILVAAGASALAFGFLPALLLRLSLRCYPPGHERREELAGDFTKIAMRSRPAWVASTMVLCLDEGLGARRRARRTRRPKPRIIVSTALYLLGPAWGGGSYILTGMPMWVCLVGTSLFMFAVTVAIIRAPRRVEDSGTEEQ